MRWLITRPQPDAGALADRLEVLGHQGLVSPLMTAMRLPFGQIRWQDYCAIAFTSRNGVAFGGPLSASAINLPAFTVGDATARAAREAGFKTVISAGGTGSELADCLSDQSFTAGKTILHISGEKVRVDLQAQMAQRQIGGGAKVERLVVYKMHHATALSEAARAGLATGSLDGVICLSPQTANLFARLASEANLLPFANQFVFAVISPATAAELTGLGGTIRIAARPDLENSLALLSP